MGNSKNVNEKFLQNLIPKKAGISYFKTF